MTCNSTITLENLENLQHFGEYLSFSGVLLLVPLLIVKLIVPKFRLFPSRLSTLFVIANLSLNLTILAGLSQDWAQLWIDKLNHSPSTLFCRIQGFLFQFFASAEVLLWLEIAVVMWFVLVKKKSFVELAEHEVKFHAVWIIGAMLMAGIPSFLHPAVPQLGASYCWLTEKDSFAYQICFLHAEMFLALAAGAVFVFKVLRKLSNKVSHDSRLSSAGGENDFVAVIWSYVLRHAMFLLGFSFIFVIIVVFVSNQILEIHGIWCVSLPMAYIHSVAVSGSGIVTFFVLSRVEYFRRAKDECCRNRNVEDEDDEKSDYLLHVGPEEE
jgi:hypothetical protein